ncbi:MAG: MEMO1 family protein [Ferroplasma sp.]
METIREPYVAGAFYPDNYDQLKQDVGKLLECETIHIDYSKLIGIIVPHAGYAYSGHTAAYAYNIIKEVKKRPFLIIGPNHYGYPRYPSIYSNGYWNTPMGDAEIDSALAQKILNKSDIIKDDKESHNVEHSIEVQLPFLQYIFNHNFKFVPLILGKQSPDIARDIAETIETMDEKPLIIISSDLNHYLPFDRNNELDDIIIKDIINMRTVKFYDDIKKYNITACGYGAIAILMLVTKYMRGKIALLNHSNSGDFSSDKKRVVGYASMLAYR